MAKGGKAGAAKRWGNVTPNANTASRANTDNAHLNTNLNTNPISEAYPPYCDPDCDPHCAPDTSPNAKQEPNPNSQYPIPKNQKKDPTEQDLERTQENSPKVSSNSQNLHSEGLKTTAGEICAALKTQGITGLNLSYQPLLEAIAQGCNLRDFTHAVEVAKEAKKTTFPYIVGIAKRAMTDAKNRLASPSKFKTRNGSVQFTADILTGRVKLPKTQDSRDITSECHILY